MLFYNKDNWSGEWRSPHSARQLLELGFQGTPDDYLSSLASAISLTDDSACFPRSTDLNADLTPAQQSMVWENAAEKAKKARALHVTQQAKMQRQSRAPLTDEEPSQVMYCTSVGYFY